MKQKTFTVSDFDALEMGIGPADLRVGDAEYILVEKSNVNTGNTWYEIRPYNGQGVSGNMDSSIKRLHGWRGTTNNVSTTACGVRKIIKAVPLKTKDATRVTVGPDLYPEIP